MRGKPKLGTRPENGGTNGLLTLVGEHLDTATSFATLFKSRFFGVYLHDLEGHFLDANDAALGMLGYTREELGGLNFATLLSEEDAGLATKTLNEIATTGGQGELTRYKLKTKSKGFVWVETEGFPVYRKGSPCAVVGIARDVTKQILAEEEVRERTESLEKAYSELKKIDRAKDEFLALVSHELRTPLTSIRSFSEILLRYENEPATQKEFLTIINNESERLTRLINNLLDFSKIEAGAVTWHDRPLSVEEVTRDAARALEQMFSNHRLRLRLEAAPNVPEVFADRDRIHQVVTNLLGNAIKFSPRGEEIRIRIERIKGKRSGEPLDWVKVSVTDEGIGIDVENFEIIFHRFRQIASDPGREKPFGTGLGLPICKEIVHHYGGNIWVESEKGKGSTFCFTLPGMPSRNPAGEAERPPGRPT